MLNPSYRQKSAGARENIRKVHTIILERRKLKLREVAGTLKISEDNVFTILHDLLSIRKLCSKWMPSSFTFHNNVHMNQRVLWYCLDNTQNIFNRLSAE